MTNTKYYTSDFDDSLGQIPHYQLYPQMRPWIGRDYGAQERKILIIAESHYLKAGNTCHHDPAAWYQGIRLDARQTQWTHTRGIIQKGLEYHWKERGKRGKAIYKVIESALASAVSRKNGACSPFLDIAFMNYFQRPAQQQGNSICVDALDSEHSSAVCASVISVIAPSLVIFCSGLAWRKAKNPLRSSSLIGADTTFRDTVHPTCRWWNIPMRKRKNKTGRELFIEAILKP